MRLFDVETSHKIGILAAKLGFFPKETRPDPACLRTTVWGREFPNPLGETSRGGDAGVVWRADRQFGLQKCIDAAMYMMA